MINNNNKYVNIKTYKINNISVKKSRNKLK